MKPNPQRIATTLLGIVLCLGLIAHGITREVPVGALRGAVTMKENGRPLEGALLHLRPILSPMGEGYRNSDESRSYYNIETGEDGSYSLSQVEAGYYELSANTSAHEVSTRVIEVKEGSAQTIDLIADPLDPYLNLYASQHVFTPEESIEFSADGFGEDATIDVAVYRLDPNRILSQRSLSDALAPLHSGSYSKQTVKPADVGERVHFRESTIVSRDAEGVFTERMSAGPFAEGLYWIECRANSLERGTWMAVTRIGIVTKEAQGSILAFAADLITGDPISGVELGYNINGAFRRAAMTGSNGTARFTVNADQKPSGVLMGRKGGSLAFVNLRANKPDGDETVAYMYTDRPIYRPGDRIEAKGLVRRLAGGGYSLPPSGSISVEIRDPDDNLLETVQADLSPMGTFSLGYDTNREAKPGIYSLKPELGESERVFNFEIAEYRKPEFSITAKPLQDAYVRGDVAEVEVRCEYYFGGPVQNAEVQVTLNRAPTWDFGPSLDPGYEDEYGYDEYADSSYGGEYVDNFTVKTDSSGRAIVRFPTEVEPDRNTDFETTDIRYTLDLSVDDGSGKYFDGKGSVLVLRGRAAPHVEISRYVVEPDKAFDAKILTYDPATRNPIPNQEVELVAGYEVWAGRSTEFRPFARQSVRTNAKGESVVSITAHRGGNVQVRAAVRDQAGRPVRSTGYVWVDKRGDLWGDPPLAEADLLVKLDRKDYDAGETCRIVVQTSEPGASALVTVEGDRIYASKVVKLDQAVTVVELPVRAEYAPNAFVGICYLKDKKLQQRQRRLAIDLGRREIDVAVRPAKAVYQPGETARFLVQTTVDGRPIAAEFSLGVVDESIYAIKEDETDVVGAFYPMRYNQVETRYSFEEIYLDGGDKAPKSIEIRKRFRDTAFWSPALRTDALGRAAVDVPLPDNLTTWRATAVAISHDTSVGMGMGKLVARKPLMVRLQTPSFYVMDDQHRLAAMVTNDSGKDADVHLELAGENVSIDGDRKRTLRVGSGDTETIEWTVRPIATGRARFEAKVWISDTIHDGVEQVVPVHPHGRLFVESTAGIAQGSATFEATVRPGADPDSGRLRIFVSPSLAGSLLSSLDELIDYPYGCVEQTMSRFLPTVLVAAGVRDAGLPAPRRASEIPRMVAEGMTRLRTMQHSDGSWGWWEYDGGDEFMTGFVLEGLARARDAGFPVDPAVVSRAKEWAKTSLESPLDKRIEAALANLDPKDADSRRRVATGIVHGRIQLAFGASLLGLNAGGDLATAPIAQGDPFALATLSLLHLARSDPSEANRLVAELKSHAIRNGELVSWQEENGVENTARALLAIVAANVDDPDVPRIIRYLMLKRRGGYWFSTRDTSAVLIAMSAFLARFDGAAAGTAPIVVSVNGEVVATVPTAGAFIESAMRPIDVPIAKLKAGANQVAVARAGGICYYTADLRQTVVSADLPALDDSGLSVRREYFLVGANKLEDGRLAVLPGQNPVQSAKAGETILVRLTVETAAARQYLILEDPIPAHCRILDRGRVEYFDDWSWWWSQHVVRDDRMAFFVTDLPPGKHELTYILRAENPGTGAALPAVVSNMYDPENKASSASMRFEVRPK